MKFKDKNVLVIGAGVSGLSAAQFLIERGARVTIYDDNRMPRYETTIDNGAVYEFEVDKLDPDNFDLSVISPGVSINHPLAQKFTGKLISELSLGFTARHKKVIAVTGTNGKTTVVNMIANVLGKRGKLCGNSGTPVTSVTRELRRKIAVTEVSSFMMEVQSKFRPKISVILNISQDHLERHGTMENYIEHKAQIFAHQKKRDITILNYDDPIVRDLAKRTKARVLFFSQTSRVRGIFVDGGRVWLNLRGCAKELFSLHELRLSNSHEVSNFLATALACKLLRVKSEKLENATVDLNHRIQHVAAVGNVDFYNDSKATNVAAALAACACFTAPIHLLVGGQPKGQDFAKLFAALPKNVVRIFTFGESSPAIMASAKLALFTAIEAHETMQAAVAASASHGTGQRVVLLSPACASFDQFAGYEDRGKKFVEVVNAIVRQDTEKTE